MKLLKRSIAVLLAVMMIVSVLPTAGAVDGKITVDVKDARLTKGNSVTIAVTLDNGTNRKIAAADIEVVYDAENLTLTAISAANGSQTSLFPASMFLDNVSKNSVNAMSMDGLAANQGNLMWLTFTTKEEVINGSYTIGLKAYKVASMFTDLDFDPFTDAVVVNAGTITVSGGVDVLTDDNTTFEGLNASYVYNDGKAIEPSVTVKYNGKTLKKDKDYTLTFENNTAVGTATVTATGIGAYKGSASAAFEITKKTGTISGTASYSKTYGDAAFTLDAAANSGAALSYASSNATVATVDAAGKVTVVGAGSAVITVSAEATENYTKPVDYKVNVTVGQANQSLTGTASYAKTYGDAAFDLNIGGAQGTLSYSSSKPSVATVDANGKVTIVGVGTTTITVNAAEVTGKYNAAEKTVTVKVEQKEVSVSGITVADKVYDKTTDAVVSSKGTINGMVEGDDLSVNATGVFANATAGENKTVNLTVSLTGTDAANYKLASDSQTTATATIEQAPVAVPTAKTGLTYNTKEQTGVEATADYTVEDGSATNAGDYVAEVTLKDAVNYKWADANFDGAVEWSIAKADAEDLTMEKSLRYSNTATQTITAAEIAQKLNAPGDVVIAACDFEDTDSILATEEYTEEEITFALVDGLSKTNKDDTASIEVTVESDNYEDVTLTITVKVIDKNDVSEDVVFEDGSADYTGKVQKHETATYNDSADGITYKYSEDPINVGTYKVTAIYEDADNYGEKTVDFRIDAVAVTVTGGEVETKDYDGNTDAEIASVEFSGLVNGEELSEDDYTVTSAVYTENANVGTRKKVSFTVELKDTEAASNYVLTGTAPVITGAIEPKEITVSLEDIAAQEFTGNAITPAVTVNAEGTVDEYVLAAEVDYTVSYVENVNVGTAEVTVEAVDGSNYTFDDAEVTFEITEAAAPAIADLAAEYTYSYTGAESFEIKGVPANAGEVTLEIGTLSGETDMVSDVTADDGEISLTVESVDISYVGKTVTIPVTVVMQNYADVQINLVITRLEKNQPVLAVQDIEKVYDGVELTVEDIIGTATFEGEELEGDWEWVTDPADMVNANEAGYEASVRFTPDDTVEFMTVEEEISVVIMKADPTGKPSYKKINKKDQTLADAELSVGTITPEGTIEWVDSLDTVVEKRVEYAWVFTPEDTTNYNTLTGEIKLYSGSSSSKNEVSNDEAHKLDKEKEQQQASVIDRYRDVSKRDWFAPAVEMVVSRGLFEGVSANRFDPNGTMTRAMLVTVLWRLENEPAARVANGFSDVALNAWYSVAVAWANENGIVTGIGADNFAPNQNITREQLAVILYRYAKALGLDCSAKADLSDYADASGISAYAKDAMSWAVAEGLISGMTETTLVPGGSATRAQVATILMRFVNYVL